MIEAQITNGIASFTDLFVQVSGSYDFFIQSKVIGNDQKFATVKFNKLKLEVSIINEVIHI